MVPVGFADPALLNQCGALGVSNPPRAWTAGSRALLHLPSTYHAIRRQGQVGVQQLASFDPVVPGPPTQEQGSSFSVPQGGQVSRKLKGSLGPAMGS